jgi:plasmid maintenance system antidote protein VapI
MNSPGPRGTLYVDGKPIGEIQTLEVKIEREGVIGSSFSGLIGKSWTGTAHIECTQPTFEELLAAQYKLTPEQAQQLAETVRLAAEYWQQTITEAWEIIRNAINQLRESPEFLVLARQSGKTDFYAEVLKQQLGADLPAHKYERPRLPSQQGYNRTPYDRWRNSLGGGRRR